jgi:cell division protein FtsZ
MLFIGAGLGGGTGTGASPVVAEIAQELEILTVAVVTTPFSWEGSKRVECADKGIEDLRKCVDALILIPNDKLRSLGKATTMIDAFGAANDVLLNSVQGIAELITIPGLINLDFADVETVMTASGRGIMGVGSASGHDRGRDAIEHAIQSPLLADVNLEGARGILLNITAGSDLTVGEFEEIGKIVEGYASEDAMTVVGTALDPSMHDSIRVTVVATGLDPKTENRSEIITDNKIDILDVPITKRNKDLFEDLYSEEEEEIDILDVPSFLRRTQA